MEEYLYDWCFYEYMNMKEYLKGHSCQLVITNTQTMYAYQGKHQEVNLKNIEKLEKEFDAPTTKLVKESIS